MCSCDVWIENSTHQASRRHLNESSVRIDVLSKATPPPVSGTPGNTTLLSLFGILVILVCIATYPVWKGPLHSKHQQTMSILFHVFSPGDQAIHSKKFSEAINSIQLVCISCRFASNQKDMWPSMHVKAGKDGFICIPSRMFLVPGAPKNYLLLSCRNTETLKIVSCSSAKSPMTR